MAFNQKDLDEINSRLSIVDVIGQHLNLQKRGTNYVALCPFHREKTPSFTINPQKNFYYCFGCGVHGNMFQFLMDYEKISFAEAVKKLALKAGVSLTEGHYDQSSQKTQIDVILEILRRVTKTFRFFLLGKEHQEVRDVLRKRKISEEVEEQFQIGFLPNKPGWLWDFLLGKKFDPEILSQTGLFSKNNKRSIFEGRLLFPIVDFKGETVSFGGRILQGEGPKYLNGPETAVFQKRKILYGLFHSLKEARQRKEIIVTEGYFDVLSLYTAGLNYAVAPLGTALTNEHFELFHRYEWHVKLMMDNDQAGLNSSWKAFELAEAHQVNTEIIAIPENCKDAGEVLEKLNHEGIRKIVNEPQEPMKFLIPKICNFQNNRNQGIQQAVKMFSSLLKSVNTQIRKDLLIENFAQISNLSVSSVKHDIMNGVTTNTNLSGKAIKTDSNKKTHSLAEWILVGCLIANPLLYPDFRAELTPEDIEDEELQGLLRILDKMKFQNYNTEASFTNEIQEIIPKHLLEDFRIRKARGEFDLNPRSIIQEGIKKIKLKNLEQKRAQLQLEMEKLTPDEKILYLDELDFINNEIQGLKGKGDHYET